MPCLTFSIQIGKTREFLKCLHASLARFSYFLLHVVRCHRRCCYLLAEEDMADRHQSLLTNKAAQSISVLSYSIIFLLIQTAKTIDFPTPPCDRYQKDVREYERHTGHENLCYQQRQHKIHAPASLITPWKKIWLSIN